MHNVHMFNLMRGLVANGGKLYQKRLTKIKSN